METPKAGPPTPTYEPWLEARERGEERERQRVEDDRLRRVVIDFAAIDRAVRTYHRKRHGLEPWTVFELPPSLRGAA